MFLLNTRAPGKPVHEFHFEYIRSEMNSQFANIATPSEIVISTTFSIEFGGTSADMHICFPYSMLEPIRDLLYSAMQSDQLSTDQRWIIMLRKQLKDVEVELVAQLATATISLRQILDMKAGDIIPLSIPEQITASVDDSLDGMSLWSARGALRPQDRSIHLVKRGSPSGRASMTDETETPQPDEAADSSMEDDWAAAMAEQAVAEAAAAQPAQIFQSFDQGGARRPR